jgi:hypothetical protein
MDHLRNLELAVNWCPRIVQSRLEQGGPVPIEVHHPAFKSQLIIPAHGGRGFQSIVDSDSI